MRNITKVVAVLVAALIGAMATTSSTAMVPHRTIPAIVKNVVKGTDGRTYKIGQMQFIMGPTGNVDSIWASFLTEQGRFGYMGNGKEILYKVSPSGALYSGHAIMTAGPLGSVDQCGVHMVGMTYRATKTHWISWYHGEQADPYEYGGKCYGVGSDGHVHRNNTRWAVYYVQTYNAGKTWVKGGKVIGQDRTLLKRTGHPEDPWAYTTDDAGSPRVIKRGGYFYMFYRATTSTTSHWQRAIARSPISSLGRPGTWKKYYNGSFSEPGVGGHQTSILSMPARGVSYNSYLQRYITVDVGIKGISLYATATPMYASGRGYKGLLNWVLLAQLTPQLTTQQAFGHGPECVDNKTPNFPVSQAYGGIVGIKGDSEYSGSRFWIYFMWKGQGKCFDQRYLVRREVSINTQLAPYPVPIAPAP